RPAAVASGRTIFTGRSRRRPERRMSLTAHRSEDWRAEHEVSVRGGADRSPTPPEQRLDWSIGLARASRRIPVLAGAAHQRIAHGVGLARASRGVPVLVRAASERIADRIGHAGARRLVPMLALHAQHRIADRLAPARPRVPMLAD